LEELHPKRYSLQKTVEVVTDLYIEEWATSIAGLNEGAASFLIKQPT
jgi:hypothetical protein